MQFFKYWARKKGRATTPLGLVDVSSVGWSNDNPLAAEERARQRLERLTKTLADGFPERRDYAYGDGRPLQEEIVHELHDEQGQCLAVLTRNAYGAVVLNCERVVFIDVDFSSLAEPKGFFSKLFGKRESAESRLLSQCRQIGEHYPELAFRVYRTFAGLRLVLLNQTAEKNSAQHIQLLRAFGSDPLYVKLCESQQSFRARLTPKPWRMNLSRPPARFPFAEEATRQKFEAWLGDYEARAKDYATCRELADIGLRHPLPVVSRVLALHDEWALRPAKELA